MKIEWQNKNKVKLATPGLYRLAFTEFKKDLITVFVQKKSFKGNISFDVCLSNLHGWGWTYGLKTLKEVEQVINNNQVECINTGIGI